MFKKRTRFAAVLLALVCLLSIPAYAVARASDQIDIWYMDVLTPGNGRLAIEFSVYGTGRMKSIGAEKISVYEEWGSSWMPVAVYKSSDSGMSASNTYYYGNTIYYSGIAGTRYKVTVTVFAEDANGLDSRTETFYIRAK